MRISDWSSDVCSSDLSFERQLTPDIDSAGPFPHGRKKRMRSWAGWNTSSLKNADGTEAWLDSAGFVAMNLTNGFLWSPEEYLFGLCAAYPWARFSSLEQCVEPEIAPNRFIDAERMERTSLVAGQRVTVWLDQGGESSIK